MIKTNFTLYPVFITERLVLRKLEPKDDREVLILRSDERVNRFLARPKCTSLEEAQQFIARTLEGIAKQGWLYWAITLKNTDALIGSICLWNLSPENKTAELGYELHPDFHGKGIMQEAVKVILQFAFEKMEVEAVTAFPTTANLPSQKLLERNGFKIETDPSGPEDLGDYVFYIYKRINH